MSDSVRPHRWKPTRLPHPWDSPGKNTGVGCHFVLQCVKVKSESEVAQSCPTPSDPMDCNPPASSIHRIFWARVLGWVAIAFSIWRMRVSKYYVCGSSVLVLILFWLSWMCGLVSIIKFGSFSAIIISNILFLLWYASYVYVISFDIIPQFLDVLGLGFFPFFLNFILGNLYWSVFKLTDSFLRFI